MINKDQRRIGKKARKFTQVGVRLMSSLQKKNILKNKKAVNAVISNLILLVAVVAVGFSVLSWSQGQSASYQKAQTNLVTQDINQLQERLSLENAYYNAGALRLYLLNSGAVNVTIQTVYLSNSPSNVSFSLKTFADQPIQSKTLTATTGQNEGYILVSQNLAYGNYKATIVTSRGSTFVYSFTI